MGNPIFILPDQGAKFGNTILGMIKMISGIKIQSMMIATKRAKKINEALNALVTVISPMFEARNRHKPYGGVMRPTAMHMVVTTPKRIGFTPRVIEIGAIMGTNMMMAATPLSKVPMNRKNNAVIIVNPSGLK